MRVALRITGAILALLGTLALLFAAYLFWGTSLIAARHQSDLRHDFDAHLHAPVSTSSPGAAGGPSIGAPAPGQPVATMSIPAIGLDMVVVQGTTASDLALGPGHYVTTPLPGSAGNVGIAGHRTTYLHPFYSLTALHRGDPIALTTAAGTFTYLVSRTLVVTPTNTSVLGPTPRPTLTLTTCNPRYSAATRLVVQATLEVRAHHRSATLLPPGVPVGRPASSKASPTATTTTWAGYLIAAGYGVLVLGLVVAIFLARPRVGRRRWRIGMRVGGALALLPALWLFFGALSPLLPGGY